MAKHLKILFLPRYSENGASSRYRFFQFFDYLRQKNIDIFYQPFFSQDYLFKKYSGRKVSPLYLMWRYFLRFLVILKLKNYDIIVIEKEVFPNLPIFFEKIFYFFNKNWIVDYDDAVYVPYKNSKLLKDKIANIIKISKAVIVANENLLNYAKKYNNNVFLIPDALDERKYDCKNDYSVKEKIVVGWTGNPATQKFLEIIVPCIQKVAREYPIVLRCVGINNFSIDGTEVQNIKWEEEKEPSIIKNFDIGIMPLTDDEFSRGKSGLKIIQYFAAGVPTIASPVGWNRNIIKNGENGFLANNEEEWTKYFSRLIEDENTRKKIGDAGRKYYESNFSFSIICPKLLNVYLTIADKHVRNNRNSGF